MTTTETAAWVLGLVAAFLVLVAAVTNSGFLAMVALGVFLIGLLTIVRAACETAK